MEAEEDEDLGLGQGDDLVIGGEDLGQLLEARLERSLLLGQEIVGEGELEDSRADVLISRGRSLLTPSSFEERKDGDEDVGGANGLEVVAVILLDGKEHTAEVGVGEGAPGLPGRVGKGGREKEEMEKERGRMQGTSCQMYKNRRAASTSALRLGVWQDLAARSMRKLGWAFSLSC